MLARTHGQPATPTTLGKEIANCRRAPAARSASSFARGRDLRQDQRRGRQLQRARRRVSRRRLASAQRAASSSRSASSSTRYTTQIEPHDWIAELLRCARARQHHPDRPLPRHLGLHLARLFPSASRSRRSRLLDDAAQGEPDRLRERRRQPRPRERAAARTSPRSCRCRAGSATSRTRPCCATSAVALGHTLLALRRVPARA